ncbi:hypothetical protein Q5530_31245 [Saccharothrix sp. BKS2]
MSLTPIYDDLLREFEGIILASKDVEPAKSSTPPPPPTPPTVPTP